MAGDRFMLWFAVAMVGLSGVSEVSALSFLSNPMHAILMGAFVLVALYHLAIGLREVIVDYVPHEGFKLLLLFAAYGFAILAALFCAFCLLRIAL